MGFVQCSSQVVYGDMVETVKKDDNLGSIIPDR